MFTERKSLRLHGFDYTQEGMYYVTICTKEMECVFGEVRDGMMAANAMGDIVREEWEKTAVFRKYVRLDAYVVMPNHVHGIIAIVRGQGNAQPVQPIANANAQIEKRKFGGMIGADSLSEIIGAFKSAVARRINAMNNAPGAPVWHRNYYEHIVRDDDDLQRIRDYIGDNPRNWQSDEWHP